MAVPHGYAHCFESASRAAGRTLSDDELDRVFSAVQGRIARNMREGMSMRDAVVKAGTDLGAEHRAAAAQARRSALMNVQKRTAMEARIDARAAAGKDGVPDLAFAIRNEMVAVNTPTEGGRFSTEAFAKTRLKEYTQAIEHDLRKAGVLKAARDGTLERQWGAEMWELSEKDAGRPSNVGVSKSPEALTIAQTMRKYQLLMRDRLNGEGAWIGDAPGYINRQTHDPIKVYKAGAKGWSDYLMSRLDPRTFDGVEDPEAMVKGSWHGIATGVHLSDATGVGGKGLGFSGPSNLARKLSKARVFHFKDAESWMDYQDRFGTHGGLFEHALSSLKRGSDQEALLNRWGTNPRAELESTLRRTKERYRERSPEAVKELSDKEHQLVSTFVYLDGAANQVVNAQLAQISAGARNIASMAKLGLVLFTHLSSAVSKAGELRYHGVGLLESYGNFATSFFKGLEGEQARTITDLTLAGAEGAHGRLMSPGWVDDTAPGTMSKITNKFFQMNGLAYTLAVQKGGVGDIMAARLGSMIGKNFDALPERTQRMLSIYGINSAEWDTLRNAPGHHEMNGRTYLTPDAAARSSEALAPKARDMLGLKLAALYSDIADRAIITPGIADKRDLLFSLLRGTPEGEAARFIAQFKSWPTAAIRQGLGRELYGGQGMAGAVSGVMHLAIAGTAFGYLRMLLGDLTKGLTPRDPKDPQTWAAAFAQGGGAGILGDFLFGQTNRFGGGLSDTLLGPVLGENTSNVMRMWNNLKAGNGKDVPPELLKTTLDNTPFINLFYARAALNYLFLNSAMESLNPGYLRRSQQSLRRNTGQVSLLSPQNHLRTFGR